MRKNFHKVRRPGYIVFGDPEYYGKNDNRGNIREYSPASRFGAGVALCESSLRQETVRSMVIYLAKEEIIDCFRQGEPVPDRIWDTAQLPQGRKFLLEVDGEWSEIGNDGCGCSGTFQKISHISKQGKFCDGVILTIRLPEDMDYPAMEKMARYYFQDMELVTSIAEA